MFRTCAAISLAVLSILSTSLCAQRNAASIRRSGTGMAGLLAAPQARSAAAGLGSRRSGADRLPQPSPEPFVSLGSFGLIDFPRSPDSAACGLNTRGDVVGFFGPDVPAWNGTEQSYLLEGNTFHKLAFPGAPFTGALGINTRREIVGWYADPGGNGLFHAFIRRGKNYANIDDPAFQNTVASNINDAGVVIGEAYDDVGTVHGFILAKGVYTTIDPPSSVFTSPLGINSDGVIVGDYVDQNSINHGFILRNGQFTTVDYPGADSAQLTGINDKGQMVGGYGDDVFIGDEDWPTPNAFFLDHGTYTPLVLPVSDAQVSWTYNLRGNRLVGLYVDSLGNIYGYEGKISK